MCGHGLSPSHSPHRAALALFPLQLEAGGGTDEGTASKLKGLKAEAKELTTQQDQFAEKEKALAEAEKVGSLYCTHAVAVAGAADRVSFRSYRSYAMHTGQHHDFVLANSLKGLSQLGMFVGKSCCIQDCGLITVLRGTCYVGQKNPKWNVDNMSNDKHNRTIINSGPSKKDGVGLLFLFWIQDVFCTHLERRVLGCKTRLKSRLLAPFGNT